MKLHNRVLKIAPNAEVISLLQPHKVFRVWCLVCQAISENASDLQNRVLTVYYISITFTSWCQGRCVEVL